jgi:hypothetical protein
MGKGKQMLVVSMITLVHLTPSVVAFTILQFPTNLRSDGRKMTSSSFSISKSELKKGSSPLKVCPWKYPRTKQTFILSIFSTALNRFHNFDIQQASSMNCIASFQIVAKYDCRAKWMRFSIPSKS